MKKIIVLAMLCAFVFLLPSCTLMQENVKKEPPIEKKINLAKFQFEDLPIPNNFKIINEDSFVYETDDYRTGIIKYRGHDNFKNVSNFFKGELPKYSWELKNSIEYQNVAQLIFEKPNWIAVTYIEQDGSEVIITLTIGPVSKTK
jgi:hypothetical protein